MVSRFFLAKEEQKAVGREIDAQFRKFLSFGGLMKKLDSHHHVHNDWSIYRILQPKAREYGFSAMRISADLHGVGFLQGIYKFLYNASVRSNFSTTNHFDEMTPKLLSGVGGTVEVMTHPLLYNGVLCDTKVPFADRIHSLANVPQSEIIGWKKK